MFIYDAKGIKLNGYELFLDAHRVVPFSFISHGHSDHLRNHKKILTTAPTNEFFAIRFKQRKRKPETIILDYFQPFEMDDCRITLYPAGHILGSAMILFEKDGMRLLYTGDFKLQPGLTSEAIQVPKADVLIMESTYGHPDYCFNQKINKLKDELNQWIDETRHNGEMPVLLAYRVGKSQEAMKMVSDMGYKVSVHPSIWEYTQIYQKFGVDFCNCTPHYDEYDSSFDVLIIPPHVAHRHVNDSFRRYRTLFLSGWAESRQAKPWVFGNQALSFSDHADFNELLQFVRMVNPQKVFTLHGFKEFPLYLKRAGYDAQFLSR